MGHSWRMWHLNTWNFFFIFEFCAKVKKVVNLNRQYWPQVPWNDRCLQSCLGGSDQISSSLGRRTFTIMDEIGNSCQYKQSLRFGSSYTLLIPPSFTFGGEVTFPTLWQSFKRARRRWPCVSIIVFIVWPLQCEQIKQVLDMEPNSISMAWQIPQYFLMTVGEVVFSVTGLEFSYSQVKRSTFWTLSSVDVRIWEIKRTLFGNIFVHLLAQNTIENDTYIKCLFWRAGANLIEKEEAVITM